MKKHILNDMIKSYDGNYITVDGREYVSVDHLMLTKHWVDSEKKQKNKVLPDSHDFAVKELKIA